MTTSARILQELRNHLLRANEWATNIDIAETNTGWNCIKSILSAVDDEDVGLALERWDDLSSSDKPLLSEEAQNWRDS
jgi:hypothetical protein